MSITVINPATNYALAHLREQRQFGFLQNLIDRRNKVPYNMTTAAKLRALLANESEVVVCPGVYDGFTARLALNAGFKTLYMVFLNRFNVALISFLKTVIDDGKNRQVPGQLCRVLVLQI